MARRYMSIWFRYLKTDWFARRQPHLAATAFVLASPVHGRMVVTTTNALSLAQGIDTDTAVADARAIIPSLQVFDDQPQLSNKLLTGLAEWCIRFTPAVAIDAPDGLILDITGCAHLWGGEKKYLAEIQNRFTQFGYDVRIAIADTIGTAWAVARFTKADRIIESGQQTSALLSLQPISLRLEPETAERLEKLGLRQISSFINMPRPALRRRFGTQILTQLDKALGQEEEAIIPLIPLQLFQERLPCLEPIVTAKGIEIALERLLKNLCLRLLKEEKGLRKAVLKCYRIDGKIEQIEIGTNRPSSNAKHLFKLFEIRIESIEPALGIELFTMDALQLEELDAKQEKLWEQEGGLNNTALSELLDRIAGRTGASAINRYVPAEHYWPERSYKLAASIHESAQTNWKTGRPRPLQILWKPQPIEVTAPIPDYPPMLFRYKGTLHKIIKADGPERIEQEWWLQQGQHRDYYWVEDEEGNRYWLFRLGHYDTTKSYQWFIHGFFA